jgi:hypothetical protein
MNIVRHSSYKLFWDPKLGWAYIGLGNLQKIDTLANLTVAPFELGGIISSIRKKYIGAIDSEITKNSRNALEAVPNTAFAIDQLMIKAAQIKEPNEPSTITVQNMLKERMLWWMNKYGCLNTYDTKPEYHTMEVFISQGKKYEWIFDYINEIGLYANALPDGLLRMRPTKPINMQTRKEYTATEVNAVPKDDFAGYIRSLIIAGQTKFVTGTPNEPMPTNMQGALWLAVDQALSNNVTFMRCANIYTPCMSLITIINDNYQQETCSKVCKEIAKQYNNV